MKNQDGRAVKSIWDYLDAEVINYKASLTIDSKWPSDIKQIVVWIHKHLFEDGLTVTEIRRLCRIGDNNFSGRFAYYIGKGIKSYIEYHRIQMSKQLLGYNEIKIVEIALTVGYTSHGAFTRAFHRQIGCTPFEYSKKVQEKYKEECKEKV